MHIESSFTKCILYISCGVLYRCVCLEKMLSQMLISVVYDLSIIFPFFVPFLLNILAVASYGWCCKCQQLNSWLWGRVAEDEDIQWISYDKAAGRMQFKIKVDNSHGMKSTNLQNTLCNRECDGNGVRAERMREKKMSKQTNKQYRIATVHFVYCLVYNLIHWA